jgi:hypothetical protein
MQKEKFHKRVTLSGLRSCFSALLFAQCGESDVCELLIFPKDKAALTLFFCEGTEHAGLLFA